MVSQVAHSMVVSVGGFFCAAASAAVASVAPNGGVMEHGAYVALVLCLLTGVVALWRALWVAHADNRSTRDAFSAKIEQRDREHISELQRLQETMEKQNETLAKCLEDLTNKRD